MRSVTPTSMVSGALRLLGVYAPGETPDATEIANGVEVCNDLIDDWATQGLTIPESVREVFTLTAGRQTYTIGDGGNFDTVRPQSIDAAATLINPASVLSVTSITRSGTTASVTKAGHGYATGQNVIIAGAVQSAYNGTFIVTVTSSSAFTYTVSGAPATPATGTITAQDAYGSAFEMPIGILTYPQYIAIPIKGLPNSWSIALYYDTTFSEGFGTIYFYPMPNATSQVVLYFGRILSQFNAAALTTDMILPPAYARALRYNLAVDLVSEYPRTDPDTLARIERIARESLGHVKNSNYQPDILDMGGEFGQSTQLPSPWPFFNC